MLRLRAIRVSAATHRGRVVLESLDELAIARAHEHQNGQHLPLHRPGRRGDGAECLTRPASLLTGRYPFRHLVGRWIRYPGNTEPIGTLRAREWTLPEVLDRAGSPYAHACIGKWHLSDNTQSVLAPNDPGGFGTYVGALPGQLPSYTSWPRVENGIERTATRYATTQTTDDAIQWIQNQLAPWVCYLAYNAPHLPFEAPPASLHTQTLSGTPSSNPRAYYRAMIEAMDTEIGRLFAALGPQLAQTNVLFLGDNGSVQNMAVAPFVSSRAKGTPYEGGLNVPLIVAGPAVQQGGREETALVCAVDVFNTVLDMTGTRAAMPAHVALDSVALTPYLNAPGQTARRTFAFSEQFNGDAWPSPNLNGHATIRDARYKLIHRYGSGTQEVFDLQADPFENTNLLARGMTQSERARYVALLNEISRLRTPRARFVPLSTGCLGSAGVPTLTATGTPVLGRSFDVSVQGAAAAVPLIFLIGLSDQTWLGQALPIDLRLLGSGPGCTLAIAPEFPFPATTSAQGDAQLRLSVPALPAALETTIFHTAAILDGAAPQNPIGLVSVGHAASVLGL